VIHSAQKKRSRTIQMKINQVQYSTTPLHIRLLGDFQLTLGDRPITSIDLPRLQSLLAYLVLNHEAPQSRSHIAYLLWPDTTDAQALSNFRTLVHRLRLALPNADLYLQVDRQHIQWLPERTAASWK